MTASFQESVRREITAKKSWQQTFDKKSSRKSAGAGGAKMRRGGDHQSVFSTKFPLTATMEYGRNIISETVLRAVDPKKWAQRHIGASVSKQDFDNNWMKERGLKQVAARPTTPPDASKLARLPKYLKPAPSGNEYVDSYPRGTMPSAFAEAFPREYREYPEANYLDDVYFPHDPDNGGDNNNSAKPARLSIPANKVMETALRQDPANRYISSTYAERNGGVVAPAPDAVNRRPPKQHRNIGGKHLGKTWDSQEIVFERAATTRLQGNSQHRKRRGIAANPLMAW